MRRLICAASLALACSVSQSAFGAVGPFARLDISGEPAPIFINAVPSGNGKTFLINGEQGYQRTTSEYSISKKRGAASAGRPSPTFPVIISVAGSAVGKHHASAGTTCRISSMTARRSVVESRPA